MLNLRLFLASLRVRAVLLTILLLGAASVYHFMPTRQENHYLAATAGLGDLEDSVLATGTVKAFRQVSVGAQVSGQIKSLKVSLGQSVRKGDVLAEIDPRTQQNTLEDAQASVNSYQAQLDAKNAALTKARQDLVRQHALLGIQATSKESFDSARAAQDQAVAEVRQLQAQLRQARVSLQTASLNLGYTRIEAPIDGVVVALPVEEGQTVNATQSAPTIVKLAQLDTMTIKAEISEGDVVRVKPGLPVSFTILGEPDKRYDAVLRAVDPGPQSYSDADDSTSSTSTGSSSSSTSTAIYYYGLFDVPNPAHKLRINMTAQVSIALQRVRQALTVPASALGRKLAEGRYSVQVLDKNGRALPREVRVGLNNGVSAQILSGLSAGETVVIGQASAAKTSSDSGHNGPPPIGM